MAGPWALAPGPLPWHPTTTNGGTRAEAEGASVHRIYMRATGTGTGTGPGVALWRAGGRGCGVWAIACVRGPLVRPDSTIAWSGAGGLKPLPRPRGAPVRRVCAAPA